MTNTDLLYAMGGIDHQLIADAAPDVIDRNGTNTSWAKRASNVAASGILVLALLFFAGAVLAVASDNNIFYQMGQYWKDAIGGEKMPDKQRILAKYDGIPITAMSVEYNKNMSIIFGEESTAERDTDYEVINEIVKSMILLEEAQRLGLEATQAEIDGMLSSAVEAYALPQGKEMIDPYLEGAGITFEEYLALLEEQAPRVISRQKLLDMIGKQYCQEHGIEFTKLNPPAEMVAAQKTYITELFEKNKHKIEYFIDVPSVP